MRRERALDLGSAAVAFALKLVASIAIVELAGFRQVSDDDYARTVIAQTFAHTPKLDPSGSSWLPFPFWLTGSVMLAFGRSIEVARMVAYLASAGATAAFFSTLRAVGLTRGWALAATVFASFGAWNLWLGAAPVPEGFAAPMMAIGILSLLLPRPPLWGALALFVAALSRYEAWPLCAVFAVVAVVRLRTAPSRSGSPRDEAWRDTRALAAIVIVVAGPLLWLAWNHHAHGSALHFVERVTRYRRMIGAAAVPMTEKLVVVPAAWLRAFPESLPLFLVYAIALAKDVRRHVPVLASIVILVTFLTAGEVSDGAPTHHPERALVTLTWLASALAAFGLERAIRDGFAPLRRAAKLGVALAGLIVVLRIPLALDGYPGQGDADRRAQVERGRSLRNEGAKGLVVVPCAYEHFALVAAFGAPERAIIEPPALAPSTEGLRVTETCPKVEVRR